MPYGETTPSRAIVRMDVRCRRSLGGASTSRVPAAQRQTFAELHPGTRSSTCWPTWTVRPPSGSEILA
jgi:hypothetical protein